MIERDVQLPNDKKLSGMWDLTAFANDERRSSS